MGCAETVLIFFPMGCCKFEVEYVRVDGLSERKCLRIIKEIYKNKINKEKEKMIINFKEFK